MVAGNSGAVVKLAQPENIPLQQYVANVVAGNDGAVVKLEQLENILL